MNLDMVLLRIVFMEMRQTHQLFRHDGYDLLVQKAGAF